MGPICDHCANGIHSACDQRGARTIICHCGCEHATAFRNDTGVAIHQEANMPRDIQIEVAEEGGQTAEPLYVKASATPEQVEAAIATGHPLIVTGTAGELRAFGQNQPVKAPDIQVVTPSVWASRNLPSITVPQEGIVLTHIDGPVLLVWEEK
jgi:hypothetical protein